MTPLHTMVRVKNPEKSLFFYKKLTGLSEICRKDVPEGCFTLVFQSGPEGESGPVLELTHNWNTRGIHTRQRHRTSRLRH